MEPQPIVPPTQTSPVVPVVPVTPTPSKLPWILGGLVLLVLVGTGGIFLGKQMSAPALVVTPTPAPVTAVPTVVPYPTADWQTYTSGDIGFSMQYPVSWKYSEQRDKGKVYAINFEGNEGNVYIILGNGFGGGYCTDADSNTLKIDNYNLEGGLAGCVMTSKDSVITRVLFKTGLANGLTLKVQTKSNIPNNDELITQILSTFKFTNAGTTIQPTEVQNSVQLQSTTGWATAENSIFSVKYSPDTFRAIPAGNSIQLQWKNNSGSLMTNSPDLWLADDYTGGSANAWYLTHYEYNANEVTFVNKKLGSASVIEAQPKNQPVHSILVSNGTKLVDVILQGTDLNLAETIASTITFK